MNIDKCTSISELVKDTSVQTIEVDEKFDSIYEKSKVGHEGKCEEIVVVSKKSTKTAIITPIVRKKHLVDYECSDSEPEEEVMKTPHPKSVPKTPKVKRQRSQTPHVKKFLLRQKVVEEYEETIEEDSSPKTTPINSNNQSEYNYTYLKLRNLK